MADKVLAFDNIETIKWDAGILAKSFLSKKDTLNAKNVFMTLEKSPLDSIAAEAYYFKAIKT